MDWIKLSLSIIVNTIEIYDLIKAEHIIEIFPLNDWFVINGEPKSPLFIDIFNVE